jgi:hypothetical protein
MTAFQTFTAGQILTAAQVSTLQGYGAAMAIFTDSKASGADGGTATSGSWLTRTLNTTQYNNITACSLASNQITLTAGTYYFDCYGIAGQVTRHQAKLRNVTAGTDAIVGSSECTIDASVAPTHSTVRGVVTITGSTVFELQHRVETTKTSTGFGIGNSFGLTMVFAEVVIRQIA